jgi:hypothetical protein
MCMMEVMESDTVETGSTREDSSSINSNEKYSQTKQRLVKQWWTSGMRAGI